MNETTKNFIEVFGSLEPWHLPTVPYRLYYDEQGHPIDYTHEDRPGNFIDVSAEVFRDCPRNVRVIDGKLRYINTAASTQKLVPSDDGGICCDPRDVCVIVSDQQPHVRWKRQRFDHYEQD